MRTLHSKIHVSVDGSIIEEESCLAVMDAGCEEQSIHDFLRFSKHTGLPIKYVFLTHFHWDHVQNLKYLRKQFKDITIIAHDNNPKSHLKQSTIIIQNQKEIIIGKTAYQVIHTPGHSEKLDDICIYLPQEKVLFSGDTVQPQGPSYEKCHFATPVPYFEFGDEFKSSLRLLEKLQIETIITGHAKILPQEAIPITLRTVDRIEELAGKEVRIALKNNPKEKINVHRICKNIFHQISIERNFNCPKERMKEDYYSDLDKKGFLYFIRKNLN
jgi:glyoxylase-like metal-dependent hydrolase (beta-lactamase superfamily II)